MSQYTFMFSCDDESSTLTVFRNRPSLPALDASCSGDLAESRLRRILTKHGQERQDFLERIHTEMWHSELANTQEIFDLI